MHNFKSEISKTNSETSTTSTCCHSSIDIKSIDDMDTE